MWSLGVLDGVLRLNPMATDADPLLILLNYGVAGVMLVLFATGMVRTRAEVQDLRTTIADQSKLIDAMRQQLTGQTLPALARSAQVLEAFPTSEQQLITELRTTVKRLEELGRQP